MPTRHRLGWALIAYGAIGLVLLVVVTFVALDAAARAERLVGSADATLASAATTADAAAAAFTGADESLDRGAASAADAATLSRDASVTLRSLAVAMETSIFGAQPLLPLADDFAATADQAASLADELDGVGAALSDTQGDIVLVGTRLEDLAGDLAALSPSGSASDRMPPLRLIVVLLAVWLGLPAAGALLAGIWLLRGGRTPSQTS
jgi:hypothetical protein